MNRNVKIWFLVMLLFGTIAVNSMAPVVSAQSIVINKQVGANESANQSWQNFWKRLYWVFVVVPMGFLMAIPWIFWAWNRTKAQHEEDPQAEMKAKKWFTTAIEIDIVLAIVATGLIFGLAYWLASA